MDAVENDARLLKRIAVSPTVLGGKPVIRGTRLSVEFVLNLLARGSDVREIVTEYDGLEDADVYACLLFARKSLEDTSFVPAVAESV
jgi:uncharacterized protein (DUF433 family)